MNYGIATGYIARMGKIWYEDSTKFPGDKLANLYFWVLTENYMSQNTHRCYVLCKASGGRAEFVHKYFSTTGTPIEVMGSLENTVVKGKRGSKLHIRVQSCNFAPYKKANFDVATFISSSKVDLDFD